MGGVVNVLSNRTPSAVSEDGIVGLEARSKHVDLRTEFEYAVEQDDVAEFELPTDGYQLFNAYVTLWSFPDTSSLCTPLS